MVAPILGRSQCTNYVFIILTPRSLIEKFAKMRIFSSEDL